MKNSETNSCDLITHEKRSKTLKEVGLKQDNLVVEANVESEEDESDDSEMEE